MIEKRLGTAFAACAVAVLVGYVNRPAPAPGTDASRPTPNADLPVTRPHTQAGATAPPGAPPPSRVVVPPLPALVDPTAVYPDARSFDRPEPAGFDLAPITDAVRPAADDDPIELRLAPNARVAIAQPVVVDTDALSRAEPGQTVVFALPDSGDVSVVVESVVVAANGDVQWQGHLEGFGEAYPASFTAGTSATFASVTTPEGSYSLEALDGHGWISKNPEMADLGTSDQVDFLDPTAPGPVAEDPNTVPPPGVPAMPGFVLPPSADVVTPAT